VILISLRKSLYDLENLQHHYEKDDKKSTVLFDIFLNFPMILELIRIVCESDNMVAAARIFDMIKVVFSMKSDIGISFQTILIL